MLRQVFQVYLADPDKLGETAAKRIETEGLHRTVCDYIAGMTDRYLMEEHARIQATGNESDGVRDRSEFSAPEYSVFYAAAVPFSSRRY